MKVSVQILTTFFITVFACLFLVVVATQSFPNHISFEMMNNIGLYLDLLYSNPSTAVKLWLQKPLVIIQKTAVLEGSGITGETPLSTQIWGLYIMPLSAIVWMAQSAFIILIMKMSPSLNIKIKMLMASMLLTISVFYVRVQACCTESPGWVLDVMILSRVFNPLLNTDYWEGLYSAISPWFNIMQLLLMSVSLIVFYFCFLASKKQSAKKTNRSLVSR